MRFQTVFLIQYHDIHLYLRGKTRTLTRFMAKWIKALLQTFSACTFCFPISDEMVFSWEFSFCLFTSYAYICTCIRRHLKETILWSSITWSEMGKQTVQAEKVYSWFSRDVTAAMLVYRTIAQKFFWEFDSIIVQNLSDILPLFCTMRRHK